MRMMVVPMLERRIELLYAAARVTSQSEPIQFAVQQTESAVSYASARLDGS